MHTRFLLTSLSTIQVRSIPIRMLWTGMHVISFLCVSRDPFQINFLKSCPALLDKNLLLMTQGDSRDKQQVISTQLSGTVSTRQVMQEYRGYKRICITV